MSFPVTEDAAAMVDSLPLLSAQQADAIDMPTLVNRMRAYATKLNGNVSHGSGLTGHKGNLDEQFIDFICPAVADTEFTVIHGLGRVPTGVQVAKIDSAGIIYDSKGGWTESLIRLKCSAASAVVKLIVF